MEVPDGRRSRRGGKDGLAKAETPEVSGKRAGAKNEVVAGCHAALAASGWCGVVRGWLVSGVRAVEWMGGELEGVEPLLLHSGRWTLDQRASN